MAARKRLRLPDRILAQVIERLAAAEAKAIGIDKYRDMPVSPGSDEPASALARHKQVVWIMKAAASKEEGVAPPLSLKGTLRADFNDVVADTGGVVRRGLIYLEDRNGDTIYSFALLLVATYCPGFGVGFIFRCLPGDQLFSANHYSALIPACRITLPSLSMSPRISAANASGVEDCGSSAYSARRFARSGVRIAGIFRLATAVACRL